MLNLGTITSFLGLDVDEFKKGTKEATAEQKELDAQIKALTRSTDSQQKVCMAAAKTFGVMTGVVKEFSPEAARATSTIQSLFAGFAQGGPVGLAIAGINALAMEFVNIYKAYEKWNKDQIAAAQAAFEEHQRILELKRKINEEDMKAERAFNQRQLDASAAVAKELEAAERKRRILELEKTGMSPRISELTARAEELETKLAGKEEAVSPVVVSWESQLRDLRALIAVELDIERNTYNAAKALERTQGAGWKRTMGVDTSEGGVPWGEPRATNDLRGLSMPPTTYEDEVDALTASDEATRKQTISAEEEAAAIDALNAMLMLQSDVVDDNIAKQKKDTDTQSDTMKAAISSISDISDAIEQGSDMILDAVGRLWDETGGRIADAYGEVFKGSGFDKVFSEGIGVFVGVIGAVVGLITALGAAIAGVLVAVAGAAVAIGVATGVLTAGAGAVIGALIALGAATMAVEVGLIAFGAALLVAVPAAAFAVSMALMKMASDTEAFSRVQKALGRFYDKLVKIMEPAEYAILALIGVIDIFGTAVAAILKPFIGTTDIVMALYRALYDLSYYVLQASEAVTSFAANLLKGVLPIADALAGGFDETMHGMVDALTNANYQAAMAFDDFAKMSFQDFVDAGKAAEDAADKLRDGAENMPRWYHFNQTREEETRGHTPAPPPSISQTAVLESAIAEAAGSVVAAIAEAVMGGDTNLYIESVESNNPREFLEKLQNYTKKKNMAITGASFSADKAYNTGG